MEKKITVGNVCFLIDEIKQKILLLKRSNEPMQNKLTGVGGKTDFLEDINSSCIREIQEETGLIAREVILKGVVKTILEGKNSSWILFVYICNDFSGSIKKCDEGELKWIDKEKLFSENIIGFIRRILPDILKEDHFIEGTIVHDIEGTVLKEDIKVNSKILI